MAEEDKKLTKTEQGRQQRAKEAAERAKASADRKASSSAAQKRSEQRVSPNVDGNSSGSMLARETAAGLYNTTLGRGLSDPTFAQREAAAGLTLAGNNTTSGRASMNATNPDFAQVGTPSGDESFVSTNINAGGGGGGGSIAPFAMGYKVDGSNNPLVFFSSNENTDVLIRGTNDIFSDEASLQVGGEGTGKPSNINEDIALVKNATNYVYLEAEWDDSSSTEPDSFTIVVYQSEQPLAVDDTDTSVTPNVEYQYIGSQLIGTIELDNQTPPELINSGITQRTNTRLLADLYYLSSNLFYFFNP